VKMNVTIPVTEVNAFATNHALAVVDEWPTLKPKSLRFTGVRRGVS
jgi:Fe-S-cluster formation regulator IscX/YfhJ